MRRFLLIFLLLAFGLALAAPPAIGSLYTRDVQGSLNMTCTASVVYGPDFDLEQEMLILTAAHCVDSGIEHDEDTEEYRATLDYFVTFNEREYYATRLLRVGVQTRGYDIALLTFESEPPNVEPLRLGNWEDVQPGTRIENWANPLGLGLQRFEGYVTMLSLDRPLANSRFAWRGNALSFLPSAGGSSGSLIMSEGRVIGVHIGVIADTFKVFVPLSKFDEFLESDNYGRPITYY